MSKRRQPRVSAWWSADRHADRRPWLLARGRIKSAIRRHFEAQGFVEVETGCLQVSPGNETHLHAFATEAVGTDLAREALYLHTSPEFACKKLLAAGERAIFTFAQVFRNRERGPLHAPEFTMLEWYRAGARIEELWEDCAALARLAADATGQATWNWRGRTCDTGRAPDFTTLDQAFADLAGIRLGETYDARLADRDALAAQAQAAGVACAADDTWSDMFARVLTERIEPHLGSRGLEFLYEYPHPEASWARPVPERPAVGERFELYACGIELANGFGELTDAVEQRRRFEAQMDEKGRIYGERYPIDEDFLAALANMPPSAGCALGFDRLVMLATGAPNVAAVQWTPFPAIAASPT